MFPKYRENTRFPCRNRRVGWLEKPFCSPGNFGAREKSAVLRDILWCDKPCLGSCTYSFRYSTDGSALVGSMEDYFSQFGDKACCFEDLRPYVTDLVADAKSRWISFLVSQEPSFVRAAFLFWSARVLSPSGTIGYLGGFAAGGQRAEATTDQHRGLRYIHRFRVILGLQVYRRVHGRTRFRLQLTRDRTAAY